MITAEDFYQQVVANKDKLTALILQGNPKARKDFVEQTAILSYCSPAERPLFLAFQYNTTPVKSYLMTALRQPLYKPVAYAIPFAIGDPKAFINAMHVQKTRLLADATGEARQDLFQATRDKLYHTFLPTPNGAPQSPYSPEASQTDSPAIIFQLLAIPFWLVQFTRTQKGEGRKWTGELPQAPTNWDAKFCVVTDDINVKPTTTTNLATKPYKRNTSEIILTDELLEEL